MPSANDRLAALVASRRSDDHVPPEAGETDDNWPCLLMRAGCRWFGLRAEWVREVVAAETITAVPSQAAHLLGVMLVHGRLVPVVDLGRLLHNLEMSLEAPPGRRLVVLNRDDVELGLVADEARGVIYLPVATLMTAAAGGVPQREGFVIGEVQWQNHLVCLFDEDRLIEAALGTELP